MLLNGVNTLKSALADFMSVLKKKKEKIVKQQILEKKFLILIFINVEETLI
jgi:hypothetical protein